MKKIRPPVRKAGIWLDQENAFIIQLTDGVEPIVKKIKSGVESRIRIRGEGKVSARFGNAFIDDQEKKQHRQRNQREKFFKEIIHVIMEDDFLYLFGPGRAKEGLNNAIEKEPAFRGRVAEIGPMDKMTGEQAEAETIRFFNDEKFRLYKKKLREAKKKEGGKITETT